MSWLGPEHINPNLQLDPQERKVIYKEAWKLWWANKLNIPIYLIVPAIYILFVWFAADWGGKLAFSIGISGFAHKCVRAASPLIVFIVCFLAGGALLQRYRFAPCVYFCLGQHGYDVCLKCGYWLKGLDTETTHCPECGFSRNSTPSCIVVP